MKKKINKELVFKLSDGADVCEVIFTSMGEISAWIETDVEAISPKEAAEREYVITLAFMTSEEINNLPEADI